jgi:hypothetical protein
MKKYLLLPIVLFLGVILSSCDSTTTEPTASTKGSIYLTSGPTNAQIWLNGTNQNKVTPDSLTNLDAGTFQITLKLDGYKDTTFSITVTAGVKTPKNVVLTSNLLTETFGPVRLWETTGTTAAQPSGLQLSSGNAYGISSTDKGKVDIYYSSDGFLVRSADYSPSLTRVTYFKVGSGSTLTDGVDSPTQTNSWNKSMSDRETNYVFLFDNDGHYSKIIITNYGGGTPGNPAYVEVEWIYNKTAGDTRF